MKWVQNEEHKKPNICNPNDLFYFQNKFLKLPNAIIDQIITVLINKNVSISQTFIFASLISVKLSGLDTVTQIISKTRTSTMMPEEKSQF